MKVSQDEYASQQDFNKFIKDTTLSLGIWGIVNLIFATPYGVLMLIFAFLIFVTRSKTLITVFAIFWLIAALSQILFGLMGIIWLILFGIINASYSIYLLKRVKQF